MTRIYFDENTPPSLAHGLNILQDRLNREPDTSIEVHYLPDVFGKGALDEEWIPVLGKEGAVVVTHDLNIHRTRSQRELYESSGVGVFFFKPPSKNGFSYWELVNLMVRHWEEIRRLSSERSKRPFAYRFTSRSTRAERMG